MRIPRIYQPQSFKLHDRVELDKETTHRLTTVLRIEKNNPIILFNGDGQEYLGTITQITRHHLQLQIIEISKQNKESPLIVHLGQTISKGEKMDFVIQKATELGVTTITPLFSERCVVHLKKERLDKKQDHWQKIAVHAAEQCGRTVVPIVEKPMDLLEWCGQRTEKTRLTLALSDTKRFKDTDILESVAILIGPEGGLTEEEIQYAQRHQFNTLKLGPRVLRTETAALVVLTAIQLKAGDL